MQGNIFYVTARDAVKEFFRKECETFPSKLENQILNYFSELGNYEEEGVKIRPNLIITNSIDNIIKHVPEAHKITMFVDHNEALFNLRMKSLISFCKLNWTIFISVKDDEIVYGLVKCLSSIKEKDFFKQVFESEVLKDKKEKLFILGIRSVSTYLISLHSLKGENININFSLNLNRVNNWDVEIKEFVNSSFSKLRTTERKLNQIKTMYSNIFEGVFKSVHGALCVVVDKDYVDNGFFSDGIWLKEPISFSKLFLQSKNYNEAKLLAFCDLFTAMLNYDGITIVDNTGTIRAYNVFVETNVDKLQNIAGGARKRAAYTVVNSRRKRIVGVYFQSHDGEIFYKYVRK